MKIDCEKCLVRDWRLADKPALLRYANNRNVWRNLAHRFPHPYTESDADSWLALVATGAGKSSWAIDIGGEAVGAIGVEPGEGIYARSGRFGYWLGEPFWGRGVMTAAVHATTSYIFDNLELVRLEAPVFEWNPASMRVLEKCGFVREGILRKSIFKDGEIIDGVLYARLR